MKNRWIVVTSSLLLLTLASGVSCLAQDGGGIGGEGDNNPGGATKSRTDVAWSLAQAFSGAGGGVFGQRTIAPLLREDKRFPMLTKAVDVHLTKATVQEAATILTQTSGLKVHVDAKTVSDKRLSIDALSAPLATILDAIAQQTNLMIARDGDGVALKPWPSLNINGEKSVYKGSLAPWADEWGTPQYPANKVLYLDAGGHPVYAGTGQGGAGGTGGITGGGGLGGFGGGFSDGGQVMPLSMTFGGDKLVIAEPATGPKGEPGYKITIYSLTGSQLKQVGSAFHASAGAGKNNKASLDLPNTFGGNFGLYW